MQEEELELDGKKFRFKYVQRQYIRNRYKLYGEYIYRNKTVKSFMKDFPAGTFLVFVAKHVFTVKDGTLVDNAGEEFRPTRKVIDVVKVEPIEAQMELFPEPQMKAARAGR